MTIMDMDNINLIMNKRLCSGCGACTVICKKNCISMKNGINYNYPCIDDSLCNNCGLCLKICPGNRILNRLISKNLLPLNMQNTLNNYVAKSNDDTVRYNAASGGVISSLIVFLIKQKYIDGAICVKQDENNPLENKTIVAISELEVLQASGSRYSPVSNCKVLKNILHDNKKYAFIGKPCEIDAINEMQKYLPELRRKIKLKVSLMCACTPSRKGTLKILQELKIEPSKVTKLSYRGNGWPGSFRVETKDGHQYCIPYLQVWNNCLSKYSCLRCMVCDDPLGNGADITVGDAWDQELLQNSIGLSAVIVRTESGRKCMDMAIENNVVSVQKVSADDIIRFQKSLISKTENSISNILAYNIVFLHKLNFKDLTRELGINIKNYYSQLKRILRFFSYKISRNITSGG